MSKSEESVGFTIAEKFFALLLILIGSIVVYNTATSPVLAERYPILFAVGGLALLLLGVFIIIARVQ